MKTRAPASVVGRKLRRALGALLAIGFGATWWGFLPTPGADDPDITTASTPENVSIRSSSASELSVPPAPLVAMIPTRPHRHHPQPLPPTVDPDPDPVVVADPDPVVVVDPDPVVANPDPVVDLPPIITRSS